jgi:hypothetical protein
MVHINSLSIVQALLGCSRIKEININYFFRREIAVGNLEMVSALIDSPGFDRVSSETLNQALSRGIELSYFPIIQALLECSRFKDINIDYFFVQMATVGNLRMVDAFIGCPRFGAISKEALGKAFLRGTDYGHSSIVQALLGCSRFPEISLKDLNTAFLKGTARGNHLLIKALIGCKRFKEISAKTLGSALLTAMKESDENNLEIVNALLGCQRRNEILKAAEAAVKSRTSNFLSLPDSF